MAETDSDYTMVILPVTQARDLVMAWDDDHGTMLEDESFNASVTGAVNAVRKTVGAAVQGLNRSPVPEELEGFNEDLEGKPLWFCEVGRFTTGTPREAYLRWLDHLDQQVREMRERAESAWPENARSVEG